LGQLTDGIWKSVGGSTPIQTGVPANKIEIGHAGWLIGQVKTAAGAPLANVKVTIAGDSSFGQTLSRADGHFDLVVNGGRSYIVRFEKSGHLPSDRRIYIGWEEMRVVPNVTLLTVDANVQAVSLGASGNGSTTFQVATGTTSTDTDGARTGKLMLPTGITATMNGSKLPNMNLRVTEYTVGADGPQRMPAPLPPTSAYTYAVEISADEALANNNSKVTFNKPAYYYVDNFLTGALAGALHPAVGSKVPSGYYDRDLQAWVPSTNGIVIKVLRGKQSIAAGSPAEIDVTGDDIKDVFGSAPVTALGFSNEEFIALQAYDDGKTLWRIPIDHMTPWDFNYGQSFDCDANCTQPLFGPTDPDPLDCQSAKPGSIIGCEAQSLGETVNVAGTPFTLNYSTSRLPLYSNWRTINLGIREIVQPPGGSTEAASLTIAIAGRLLYSHTFGPGPYHRETFSWDGLDAFGRPVVGSAIVALDGYSYGNNEYIEYVDEFGRPTNAITKNFIRRSRPFSYHYSETRTLPAYSPLAGKGSWSLGGWTLSSHHFYDVKGNTLYLGSGQTRKIDPGMFTMKRVLGSGGETTFAPDNTSATAAHTGLQSGSGSDIGIAVAPNGDVYYTDQANSVVRRVNSVGLVKTIAGVPGSTSQASGCTARGDTGDSVVSGRLTTPSKLAFAPNGDLYVWDAGDRTIRSLHPSGPDSFTIDTVAGTPCVAQTGPVTELPAKNNPIPAVIGGLAVGPDGAVYFADYSNKLIRKFAVGGKTIVVAGNGGAAFTGSNGAIATTVAIGPAQALAVGRDGSVYSTSGLGQNLFKVLPDGTMRLLSGPYQSSGTHAENVASTTDFVDGIRGIAVSPDDSITFNDNRQPSSLRLIERTGIIRSISKSIVNTAPVDGAASLANGPTASEAVAISPDGSTLAFASNTIYRISTDQEPPTTTCADSSAVHLLPSGDEAFCFDQTGRHLSTINWRTKQRLLTFGYDPGTGRLLTITDANGLVTHVDFAGSTYTIRAPYLQTTTLTADINGNVTQIHDALGDTKLTPQADGHLDKLIDRNGNNFLFTFTNGLLTADQSPLSATPQTLLRSDITDGFRVTHTTPLGRLTTYDSTKDLFGQRTSVVTLPNLTKRTRLEKKDGGSVSTAPDLTLTTQAASSPDPLWGFRQPVAPTRSIRLPSGLTLTTSNVTCPSTVSGPTTTQFSATAQNPAIPLACNVNALANPLADQSSPAFTNPPHSTLKRDWDSTTETLTRYSVVGRSTIEKRDAQGRVSSMQVGSLTPTLYVYDPAHPNQLQYIKRGVRQTELRYTAGITPDTDAGFVAKVIAPSMTTDFTRDIFGRVRTAKEAPAVVGKEGTTALNWDANGNLKLVTPPTLHDHTLLYDAINGLQQYTPPVVTGITTPQTTYAPDADRAANTEARPDGITITRNYVTTPTNTGQLDTIAFTASTDGASPAGLVDYDYFPATDTAGPGKLQTIKGPYGTTKLSFQHNGQLTTQVTWDGDIPGHSNWGSISWGYNSQFLKSHETVAPGSPVFLGYDADQLLTCVSPTSSVVGTDETATCNPLGTTDLKLTRAAEHGMVTDIASGNAGLTEHIDYTDTAASSPTGKAFGELRHQSVTFGATPLADFTYDTATEPRDDAGRIQVKTEKFGTAPSTDIDYHYDERGRLYFVDAGTNSESITYDTNGNRTSYSGPSGSVAAANISYDNQDRLLTYGSMTFTYGKNGELRTKTGGGPTTTYTYDALGNLTKVQRAGLQDIVYTVDGLGRRIGKTVTSSAFNRRWIYRDGLHPVAEIDGVTGAVLARYVYGSRPNVPDLVIKGAKTFRLIVDQLGSPRMAVNVADATEIPYRVDYSAFGAPTWRGTGAALNPDFDWIPFGFAGGLYDAATGLVRFGARDYDPGIGRWISKDPIRFDGGQANLYVYAGNDPINSADATGLSACTLGILGIVVSCGSAGGEIAGALAASVPTGGLAIAAGIGAIAVQSFSCAAAIDSAVDACKPPPEPPPARSCGSH
jgi:RHS repeat-associated protein